MPARPLGRKKGVSDLAFGPGAVWERPTLARHVMSVIAAWSSAESHFLRIGAKLLTGRPDVAMAMLLSIESQATQRNVIRATARQVLREQDFNLLNAVCEAASPSRRVRHGFAHHVWGTSPQLLDDLLLLDPKQHSTSLAAYEKWVHEKGRTGVQAEPESGAIDRSQIFRWNEKDLSEAHRDALRSSNNFILLGAMVASEFSGPLSDTIRQQLLMDPKIRDQFQTGCHTSALPKQPASRPATAVAKSTSNRQAREKPSFQ